MEHIVYAVDLSNFRGVLTLLLRQHTSSWGRLVCWKAEPTPVEKSWKIEIIVGTLLLRETKRP